MRPWFHALVFFCLTLPVFGIYYGQPRDELLRELGRPNSALRRGERVVLLYPNGARVELEHGKVVFVQGLPVTEPPGHADAAPAAEAVADVSPAQEAPPAAAEAEAAPAEKAGEAEEPDARAAEVEKALAELERAQESEEVESSESMWMRVAVDLFVTAAMMLAALKLTTKFWDLPVEFGGLAIAAGVDAAVRFTLTLIGEVWLGLPSMFYLDEVIATCVLVAVIRHVSDNKSLGRAVTIAMSSKVFSIVVGSMVAVAVMNGLF